MKSKDIEWRYKKIYNGGQNKLIKGLTSAFSSSNHIADVKSKLNTKDWKKQSDREVASLTKSPTRIIDKLMDAEKLLRECSHLQRNITKKFTSTGLCMHG